MVSYIFQVAVFLLMLPLGKAVSKSDSAPTIKLKGRQWTGEKFVVYQLECSTPNNFHGCSIEMLLNDATKETIRYSNYTCYNGNGVCSPFQCACSNECNKFSWNYTVKEELKHQIFKCDSRIQNNNYFYKVFASGFFKEGDFVDGKNEVEIVRKDQSSSHTVLTDKESTVTTVSKEQQNYIMYNDVKGLMTAVLFIVCLNLITCIICIFLFYRMCLRMYKDDKDETDWLHRRMPHDTDDCMLDRRMSCPRCDGMLDRRMSIARYDELSQDEDSYDEENEGKHLTCTRRKCFKNVELAETCRSNTDNCGQNTIRKSKRRSNTHTYKFRHKSKYSVSTRKHASQNVDIDSDVSSNEEESNTANHRKGNDLSPADHNDKQGSTQNDESHTLENDVPVKNGKASRNRLKKIFKNQQNQTSALQSTDKCSNKDVDESNSVSIPAQT